MKGKLGDKQRLLHIIDAISAVETYIALSDFDEFSGNSMMRFASIKQIEIIGEAANHITDDTKTGAQDIEWRQIIGLRHILIHEYFGVDTKLVWQIITTDLPRLKIDIAQVILNLDKHE